MKSIDRLGMVFYSILHERKTFLMTFRVLVMTAIIAIMVVVTRI